MPFSIPHIYFVKLERIIHSAIMSDTKFISLESGKKTKKTAQHEDLH